MATILVLTDPHDLFRSRHFLVHALLPHWTEAGHRVVVHEGTEKLPSADVAILHVDRTVVPDEYLEALRTYPVAINGASGDIGKRRISANLVGPYDDYAGPVIVKTNANAGGIPERLHEELARLEGKPLAKAARYMPGRYPVYPTLAKVPVELRLDPDLVIEKFLPERGDGGYCSRHWIFLGDRGWCSRVLGSHPVVKGSDILQRDLVPVADEIRAARERLGFAYGKFDYVIHDGAPVLLDVNRTPTVPATLTETLKGHLADLAKGIDALL